MYLLVVYLWITSRRIELQWASAILVVRAHNNTCNLFAIVEFEAFVSEGPLHKTMPHNTQIDVLNKFFLSLELGGHTYFL